MVHRRIGRMGNRFIRVPAAGSCQSNWSSCSGISLAQLKIMQEVITLIVFVPFAIST